MDRNQDPFESLRARIEEWCKLYPREWRLLGAIPQRELEAARQAVDIDCPLEVYFLRCGNCGNEEIASRAAALFHHRVGDPTFLCNACSEAYEARAKQMLREHLTAPQHLRSAWARIRANGGRGILESPPQRAPKTGDPVRN